jgi:hypothetical protein
MSDTAKKILKEEYNRLKKVFKKILNPKEEQVMPQLVLQPVRNKKLPGDNRLP